MRIAHELITAKWNPDTLDNVRETAIMYAALFQRHYLLGELKAQGIDMNATDVNSNHIATQEPREINNH